MSEQIHYVGNGKKGQYGIRISVCINDIAEYAKENIEKSANGKKYINLDINERKEVDKFGNTHSVKINTWKPEKKEPVRQGSPEDFDDTPSAEQEVLPF